MFDNRKPYYLATALSLALTCTYMHRQTAASDPVPITAGFTKPQQQGDPDEDLVNELKQILASGKVPNLCDWLVNKSIGQTKADGKSLAGGPRIPRRLYWELRKKVDDTSPSFGYRLVFLAYQLSESEYDRMDREDKLICQCAALKYAQLEDLPSRCALQSDSFLQERFQRFASALTGMESADARPYIDDLVLASSELAIAYPDLGPRLGKCLGKVLDQAKDTLRSDNQEQTESRAAIEAQQCETRQRLAADLDGGNLAATGHFCIAHRLISDAISSDDVLTRIDNINKQKAEIRTHLETGSVLLTDKSMVWLPFKLYSDELLRLYEALEDEQDWAGNKRDILLMRSATVLYEGIRIYLANAGTGQDLVNDLKDSRRELYSRVLKYALGLQQQLRFDECICFASKYVDTKGVLENEGAEQIHALLAKANFVLDYPYEYHLGRCNGLIDLNQLKSFKEDIGSFILSRKMKPCQEEDW